MDADEIYRYAELGRGYGVRVDVRLVPEYPGFVRVVGFHRRNRVIVEYYALGHDEDAVFEFMCDFPSLGDSIASIEDYLGAPAGEWTNYNRTGEYPDATGVENLREGFEAGQRRIVADYLSGSLGLPRLGDFSPRNYIWSSLEEYDEFMRRAKQTHPYP
jgi:hypothetical protein